MLSDSHLISFWKNTIKCKYLFKPFWLGIFFGGQTLIKASTKGQDKERDETIYVNHFLSTKESDIVWQTEKVYQIIFDVNVHNSLGQKTDVFKQSLLFSASGIDIGSDLPSDYVLSIIIPLAIKPLK